MKEQLAIEVEPDIYAEIAAERARAHAKHGDTSMESLPIDDLTRLSILVEEVGEVAREFNDARHERRRIDLLALRKELIQTAAMAAAWACQIEATEDARSTGKYPAPKRDPQLERW